MGHPGFEPGTNRLKAEYSTVELVTLSFFATFSLYQPLVTMSSTCQRKFEVNFTELVLLVWGAKRVRFSPVLRELRPAVQGSRQ